MKIKRIACTLLAAIMATGILSCTLMCIPVAAATSGGVTASIQWLLKDDGTLRITGTGELPQYDETGSDLPWKAYLNSITSVSIGAGITSIRMYCFANLPNATSISFDDGSQMKSATSYSFYKSGFTEITLPKNMTVSTSFARGSAIENIYVESGHTSYVSIDGVLYTKDKKTCFCYPFAKKDTEYTVLNGVTDIPQGAFVGNVYIQKVNFPSTLNNINEAAFSGCTSLKEANIPNKTRVLSYAFANTALESVAYTATCDTTSFSGCTKIKSFSIGVSLSTLSVINSSNRLTELTLYNPAFSLSELNKYKTTMLSSLTKIRGYTGSTAETYARQNDITFEALPEPTDHKLGDDVIWEWDVSAKHLTLRGTSSTPGTTYTFSSFDEVPCAPYVVTANYITVENVKTLQGNILLTNNGLVTDGLTLGEGLENFNNSFINAGVLQEVTFPSTLKYVGGSIFANVSSIKKFVVAPGNTAFKVIDDIYLTDISGKTLYISAHAALPSNVTVPDGVQTIRDFCFSSAINIQTLQLPASVTSIKRKAFINCKNLTSVDFSRCINLSSLEEYAFYGTKLSDIDLSNTKLTSLSKYSFWYTPMTILHVPKTLTAYGTNTIPPSLSTLYCYSKTCTLPVTTSMTLCYGYRNAVVDFNAAQTGTTFIAFDADKTAQSGNIGINWFSSDKTLYLTGQGSISLSNAISSLAISKEDIENIVVTNKVTLTGNVALSNLKTCTTYNNSDSLAEVVSANPTATFFSFANSSLQTTCGSTYTFYPLQAIGDNAYWYVDSSNTLHLTGAGATYSYSSKTALPYYDYLSTITAVEISKDITSIGNYLFAGITQPISIDSHATKWGSNCFNGTTLSRFVAREPATYSSGTFINAVITDTVFYDYQTGGSLTAILEGCTYKDLYAIKPTITVDFPDADKKFAPGDTFTITFRSDSDFPLSTISTEYNIMFIGLSLSSKNITNDEKGMNITFSVLGENPSFTIFLMDGAYSNSVSSPIYNVLMKDHVNLQLGVRLGTEDLAEPYTITYNDTDIAITATLSA